MYNKMEAMKPPPEGRTASAWQHYFRDVKKNAVEMLKGYESAKGVDSVSGILMFFLQCKMEDEEMVGCGVFPAGMADRGVGGLCCSGLWRHKCTVLTFASL